MKNIRIGDLLKEYGYVTDLDIENALEYQQTHKSENLRLGDALVAMGCITDMQRIQALSKRLHYPIINLRQVSVNVAALGRIPKAVAEKYGIIAFDEEGSVLKVALTDPLQFQGIEDVRQITGMRLEIYLDEKRNVEDFLSKNYGAINAKKALEKASKGLNVTSENIIIEDTGDDAPVVAALNKLLIHAYNLGASDIHIEPFDGVVLVRVRLDGVMSEIARLNSGIQLPLIARIKIMADMDIAEKRMPQDGHFKAYIDNQEINGRVSVIPTVNGEKAVIRFIFQDVLVDGEEHFGMSEENYKKFDRIIKSPHGIVFITGPTGSGKTTTLYMTLEDMAKKPINISTIEDPVERNINGINQMQTNNLAGLTFESGLRAILRQDPDVIMVGETRDAETATIAVRSAITGHLVFSTLHTNDAVSAIIRLEDMGIPPYMVANSLSGIVAQRLMRKVCPNCAETYEAGEEECQALGVPRATLKRGCGCSMCNGTGFKGRIAVHEVVEMDRNIRRLVTNNASQDDIEDYLVTKPEYTTLKGEAAKLTLAGITSFDEYLKLTFNMD